jgi:hypothetical protein
MFFDSGDQSLFWTQNATQRITGHTAGRSKKLVESPIVENALNDYQILDKKAGIGDEPR